MLVKQRWFLLSGILLLLGFFFIASRQDPVYAAPTNPVLAAWEAVQTRGSYHFTSDVTQVTKPLATLRNAGRRSHQDNLHLEGQSNLKEQAMTLRFWSQGGAVSDANSSVEVRVADGKTMIRQPGADWQEQSDFTGSFAPNGDFLVFLSGVRNLREIGTETRNGISFTRYTFEIDGPTVANYLREQLQTVMTQRGELPPGMHLKAAPQYADLRGSGEIWIDGRGLPLRQVLDLTFPPERGEQVTGQIVTDFSKFAEAEPVYWRLQIGDWRLGSIPQSMISLLQSQVVAMFVLCIGICLCLLLLYHRQARRLYSALALALIAAMVGGPLLQNIRTATFLDVQAAKAAQVEAQRLEFEAVNEANASANQKSFDPSVNLLADDPPIDPVLPIAPTPEPLTASNTISDTDLDGLTDFNEERIGTSIAISDTDGDSISDGVEVLGFLFNSRRWYGDPFQTDSNRDGQTDTMEWQADRDNNSLPDDIDNDGTPDLFDEDNDGDGVVDRLDLSPYAVMRPGAANSTFNENTPFSLAINNLQAGKPLFVDFQLRPRNEKHLWYALNVLDWPEDKESQLQDGDGATFADCYAGRKACLGIETQSQPGATSPFADHNGDLKLIPLLEVRMAITSTNLPATNELADYGITIRELPAPSNQKVLYVPLRLAYDDKTGGRIAFQAHMPYLASGDWSQAHSVRLVWLVQMLNDICEKTIDGVCTQYKQLNQVQVIQTYYDDWVLTGLSVREEHNTSMGMIYEQPSPQNRYGKDDYGLVSLAYGLDNSFLIGRDQDNDGERDITLAELDRRFDITSTVAISDRWAITSVLHVDVKNYDTFDRALITTGMTETTRVLSNTFNSHWQADNTLKPLILYAREESYRSQSLDGLSNSDTSLQFSNGQLTINFADVPTLLLTGVKWSLYCATSNGSNMPPTWRACDANETWIGFYDRYADRSTLDNDSPDMAAARLAINRLFAFSLYQGLSTVIRQNGTFTMPRFDAHTDAALAIHIRDALKAGAKVGTFLINRSYLSEAFFKNAVTMRKVGYLSYRTVNNHYNRMGLKLLYGDFSKSAFVKRVGSIMTKQVLGILGGLIAVGGIIALIALDATNASSATQAAVRQSLSIVALVISVVSLVGVAIATVQLYNTLRTTVSSARAAFSQTMQANSALVGSTQKAAAIGAAIGIAIVWGFFLYQMLDSKASAFSPEANAMAAYAIAATLMIVLMAVLSISVVGLVIVSVIAFVDSLLTVLCEFGVDALKKVPGMGGACFTLNGAATQYLAKLIYSYDIMIDTERPELVASGSPDVTLRDPQLGFVANNSYSLSLPITTTAAFKNPSKEHWHNILWYLSLYDNDTLRSTSFRHRLGPDQTPPSASRNDMRDAWTISYDHLFMYWPMMRAQAGQRVEISNVTFPAGINRTPSTAINLNTAFALPAYECWAIPNPLFIPPTFPFCRVRGKSGSNSSPFTPMQYDILPATFAEFVAQTSSGNGGLRLNWDTRFPTLIDADGDGLTVAAQGGVDPNDLLADADGDSLIDSYEIDWRERGLPLSPASWDSDSDGLSDAQELSIGSNPLIKDTDNDGLFDGAEVYHRIATFIGATGKVSVTNDWVGGWNVVITGTQPLTIVVSSDPTQADTDLDGISDQAEKELATHVNLSWRLDPDGRPYHPQIVNRNPLVVYNAINDSDGIVRPGQTLLLSTTVTNLGATGLFTSGGLEVRAPVALGGSAGGAYATHLLGLTQSNVITKGATFIVAANASTQNFTIESLARARLTPPNPPLPALTWVAATPGTLGGFTAATPAWFTNVTAGNAMRQDTYLVNALTHPDPRASNPYQEVYQGDVRLWGYPNGSALSLENDGNDRQALRKYEPNDVACTENGKCMTVWSEYDNCTTYYFDHAMVENDDGEASGNDILMYIDRNDAWHPGAGVPQLWWRADNMQTGWHYGINRTEELCGTDGYFPVREYDTATPPADPYQSASGFYSLYRTVYYFGGNYKVWTYTGEAGGGTVSVQFHVHYPDEQRNKIMGSVTTGINQTVTTSARCLTQPCTNENVRDLRPVIASNGSNFLVVWERIRTTATNSDPSCISFGCQKLYRAFSQRYVRLFNADSEPLSNEQPLGGEELVYEITQVSTPQLYNRGYFRQDVAWVGDAYRVAAVNQWTNQLTTIDVDANGTPLSSSATQRDTNVHANYPVQLAYDPVTGRHLLTYHYISSGNLAGRIYRSRSDATPISLATALQPTVINQPTKIAYHPLARGWLLFTNRVNDSPPVRFDYRLINPDGTLITNLSKPAEAWPITQAYADRPVSFGIACPAPNSQPKLTLPFEELPGATSFADVSGSGFTARCAIGNCPMTGVEGAPNAPYSDSALQFSGSEQVTTTVSGMTGNRMVVAFWFKPTSADATRKAIVSGNNWSIGYTNDKIDLEIGGGVQTVIGTVNTGVWQHVLVTIEGINKAIYINGELTYYDNAGNSLSLTSPFTLQIGRNATLSSFKGVIDHLQLYNTAYDTATAVDHKERRLNSYCLATASGDANISAVKLNLIEQETRGGLVKASSVLSLTIDGNPPTSTVTSPANNQYIRGTPNVTDTVIIAGSANDNFGIRQVEVSVNGGAWQVVEGAAAWSHSVEFRQGRYSIQSRATDSNGTIEVAPLTTNVAVDAGSPTLTVNVADQASLRASSTFNDRWIAPLSGTASDPLIGTFAGSGIQRVEVMLQGVSASDGGNGWQTATLNGGNWSLNYRLPTTNDPTGVYSLTVKTSDKVGNVTVIERSFYLDAQGPEMQLGDADAALPVFTANTLQITGTVSDRSNVSRVEASFTPIQRVEALSSTVLHLPFDEAAGAIWYQDQSDFQRDARCQVSGCATAGDGGRRDRAVRLTGGALQVTNTTGLDFGVVSSFSIQTWVRITRNMDMTLIGINDNLRIRMTVNGQPILAASGMSSIFSSTRINDNQWHHLVAVIDRRRERATLYLDGVAVGNRAFTAGLGTNSPIQVGTTQPGSAYWLDEVMIMANALSPDAVKQLYQTVDTPWRTSALAQSNASTTTWTLAVPNGLEGQYQLDLRGVDGLGNDATKGYAWRGLVDTLKPRIAFTATATGASYTTPDGKRMHAIKYDYSAVDRHLTELGFRGPCGGQSAVERDFADDAEVEGLFPDLTVRNQLHTRCTIWEPTSTPTTTVQACDLYDNCATSQPSLGTVFAASFALEAVEPTTSLVITPTNQAILAVGSDGKLPLTLVANSLSALRTITVLLDGVPIEMLNFDEVSGVTVTQEASVVTIPNFDVELSEGIHILATRASDWAGNEQQILYPIQVRFDTHDPQTGLIEESLGEENSYELGNSMMRLHGNANDPGTQASGLAAVQISVDDGPFVDVTFEGNGGWNTALWLGDDTSGRTYKFTVRAIDKAGRITDVSKNLLSETQPSMEMETTITAGPLLETNDLTATFEFTGSSNVTATVAGFLCQLDGGDFNPCSSPQSYYNLDSGEHSFRVLVTNGVTESAVVDLSPASYFWRIDATGGAVPPQLHISDANLIEGNAGEQQMVFNVTLDAFSPLPVTVQYTLTDGSALGGSDFASGNGVIEFAAMTTQMTISVPIYGDAILEADETFTVMLSNPTNAEIADSEAVGVILNDDESTLTISGVTLNEGDSGVITATFAVTLSAPSELPVSVNYATSNDSASEGDYTPSSGMLNFVSHQITQTIDVLIHSDTIVEADERFTVTLDGAVNASIRVGEAVGLIENDDSTALSISDGTIIEGDIGEVTAHFTVTLSNPSDFVVSVNYVTLDETAQSELGAEDYMPISGTLAFEPHQTTQTISVTVLGDIIVETDEILLLHLSEPVSATIDDGEAVGVIVNDDSATLAIGDSEVVEGDSGEMTAIFTVTLSHPSDLPVGVDFATLDGTASSEDYTPVSGTLAFDLRQTTQVISVTVLGDPVVEANESFTLTLRNPLSATIDDGEGSATIINDDGTTLSILDAVVIEGNEGVSTAHFTVTLSNPSDFPVTVDYAASTGTASSEDFVPLLGMLTLDPQQTTAAISVPVTSENVVEADETFTVTLSNPFNATVSDSEAVGVIVNDDSTALSISNGFVVEGNDRARSMILTVTLSHPSDYAVTVGYATVDGTALATDGDYVPLSGTIVFAAGQVEKVIVISVLGDVALESDEMFIVVLSHPVNAELAQAAASGLIVNDDQTLSYRFTRSYGIVGIQPECDSNVSVVPVGTMIRHCYTITNSSPYTLVEHTLEDSLLGLLIDHETIPLAPGASLTKTITAPLVIDATSVATWTVAIPDEASLNDVALAAGIDTTALTHANARLTLRVSSAVDDQDGDTLADNDELATDGDGDNLPNFLDGDSDNDTLSDQIEGLNDADQDNAANFVDLDADGDTLPDYVEGNNDMDDDSLPNFLDLDSDNDGLVDRDEAGANPVQPADQDSDGVPDYLDVEAQPDVLRMIYLPLVER